MIDNYLINIKNSNNTFFNINYNLIDYDIKYINYIYYVMKNILYIFEFD